MTQPRRHLSFRFPDPDGAGRRSTGPALVAALLAIFALPPGGAAADAALGAYLAGACTGCHQLSGQVSGNIPAIVGMPEAGFIAALTAYKTGERDNTVMRNIAERLSEEDIAALAAFFAAQKQ
jgi:cytochrome c553